MLTRLTHSAIAFAITVVVYQVYALVATPLIAMPPTAKTSQPMTAAEREAFERGLHKHRELLAAYFPPNHWTLNQPPITAEKNQTMIIVDQFNPRDDGQVRVEKCAMLFFPSGRERGELPPSDTIVLEAPQGAVLQMDESFNNGLASLGKLQWARLAGRITIRSEMREPGPHDDLLLTTRDLYMNENFIRTDEVVDMQLGPHRGRGRKLEIMLAGAQQRRSMPLAAQAGNIDSLEILEEVEAQLAPGPVRLGGMNKPASSTADAPPIKIVSDGPFRFDFVSQVASFNQQVQLTQLYPTGQLDEMRCETLSIYFARPQQTLGSTRTKGKFTPGLIEALGTDSFPVVLSAPSQQARARCQRVRLELIRQRITFDDSHEVELHYENNEIHAKQVQYMAPPKNSAQHVGDFRASGSGWLRAQTSSRSDTEPLEVRWTENMRLRRINGRPVLSLNGRPRLDMLGVGQLWADQLDLYLRERLSNGSASALLPSDVVPERLVASGKIAIDSAQLRGNVRQLDVRFEYDSGDLLLTQPDNNSPQVRRRLGRRGGGLGRAYDIVGEKLDMLVTVRNKKPEVTSIDVDGQVVFSEVPSLDSPKSQQLQVAADHLQIKNADSPTAEITLSGRPATINTDSLSIRAEHLQIDRGKSRAWVETPGEIEMLMKRGFDGRPLATPQPMTIRWQRRMELHQKNISFVGDVLVQTGEGRLDTHQLVVTLTDPIQFDGGAESQKIEIDQLACAGGVNAIFSQRDPIGLASVQKIELEDSFTANLQSGQLRGTGPGWLESVHLTDGDNPLGPLAKNTDLRRNTRHGHLASASHQSASTDQRLRFLGVKFIRGVQGNLHRRQVNVHGNVEAVYGPVDAWEQRLPLTKRGMPGRDTVWISSESLGVAESPLVRLNRDPSGGLGPIELIASGNRTSPVTIEGAAGERGNFTTQSLLAKFDQLKKTFILEGNNQQPATLSYQQRRGAQPSNTKARKITYFQATGDVQAEGLMSGQLRQLAPASGR